MFACFLRGFFSSIQNKVKPIVEPLIVLLLIMAMIFIASVFGFGLIEAIWFGVLGFIFLGAVLALKSFVVGCCERGMTSEQMQESSSKKQGKVVQLSTYKDYR